MRALRPWLLVFLVLHCVAALSELEARAIKDLKTALHHPDWRHFHGPISADEKQEVRGRVGAGPR